MKSILTISAYFILAFLISCTLVSCKTTKPVHTYVITPHHIFIQDSTNVQAREIF